VDAIERVLAQAQEIEASEAEKTKAARKQQQIKKENAKSKSPASVITKSQNIPAFKAEDLPSMAALADDEVELFGDVV